MTTIRERWEESFWAVFDAASIKPQTIECAA